ncbi:G patch domain-containing protein 2-like [Stigmatopora argus]
MEDLPQDLTSALEQTSEYLKRIWGQMLPGPINQSRQVRRRSSRKRRSESSLHCPKRRLFWLEASESGSGDTPPNFWQNSRSTSTVSLVNRNESDDKTHSIIRDTNGTIMFSWPESDSLAENNQGQAHRRKKKVKRGTSHTVRLQQKLKVSGAKWKRRPRSSKLQSTFKNKFNRQTGGGRRMEMQSRKNKILKEPAKHADATDQIMSESDTSNNYSSDTDLFTNDEGRQALLTDRSERILLSRD